MWRDDLNYGLSAFGIKIPERLPIDEWATRLAEKPATNSLAIVGISATLFYAAEKNHNPKVNSIYDAFVFCSTCLSVGYHDVFPRTPVGKLITTLLMTFGPALAAKALDGPKATEDVQQQILASLKDIAGKLEQANQKLDDA